MRSATEPALREGLNSQSIAVFKPYCVGLLLKRLLNLLSYVGDRSVVPETKPGQDHQRNNPVEESFFANRPILFASNAEEAEGAAAALC